MRIIYKPIDLLPVIPETEPVNTGVNLIKMRYLNDHNAHRLKATTAFKASMRPLPHPITFGY